MGYQLNAYTRQPSQMARIRSDLNQDIQDEFSRAGVQIMSRLYVADPAEPKLVPPARWSPGPRSARRRPDDTLAGRVVPRGMRS